VEIRKSIQNATKTFSAQPLMYLVTGAVFSLASPLNFLVCPIQFLALACAYEDDFGKEPPMMHFYGSTGAK